MQNRNGDTNSKIAIFSLLILLVTKTSTPHLSGSFDQMFMVNYSKCSQSVRFISSVKIRGNSKTYTKKKQTFIIFIRCSSSNSFIKFFKFTETNVVSLIRSNNGKKNIGIAQLLFQDF